MVTGTKIIVNESLSQAGSFEQGLDRLEVVVRELESGKLTLEQSLQSFQEGIALVRQCRERLQAAEQTLEILSRDEQGQIQLVPANWQKEDDHGAG